MRRLAGLRSWRRRLAAGAGRAWAQADERDRFYVDKDDDDRDKTLWQGSLTSSSFFYTESGTDGTPYGPGGEPPSQRQPVLADVDRAAGAARRSPPEGRALGPAARRRLRVVPDPWDSGRTASDPTRIAVGLFGASPSTSCASCTWCAAAGAATCSSGGR
jgi:hypothetical protein